MVKHRAWGWVCWGVLSLAMAGGITPDASASDAAGYVNGALRKLGRGVANVATCPAELLRVPTLVGRKDGTLASITVGVAQGAWQALARGVSGVFEIVTFYAETPKGFAPVVRPEFVWQDGDWAE